MLHSELCLISSNILSPVISQSLTYNKFKFSKTHLIKLMLLRSKTNVHERLSKKCLIQEEVKSNTNISLIYTSPPKLRNSTN